MTVVKKDGVSLFVVVGGHKARPGPVRGFSHAYDMGSADLKEGDQVKARHLAGSQITRLVTADGTVLHWHHEGWHRDRWLEG